jgi:hypothetical protein
MSMTVCRCSAPPLGVPRVSEAHLLCRAACGEVFITQKGPEKGPFFFAVDPAWSKFFPPAPPV